MPPKAGSGSGGGKKGGKKGGSKKVGGGKKAGKKQTALWRVNHEPRQTRSQARGAGSTPPVALDRISGRATSASHQINRRATPPPAGQQGQQGQPGQQPPPPPPAPPPPPPPGPGTGPASGPTTGSHSGDSDNND
ncbi:hypothetical protein LY78DRAFT_196305 [Colletotrichum sublineola]|nr:hypothetical protein LY78DRAFT_196305 [Colletotrichum sublineola]